MARLRSAGPASVVCSSEAGSRRSMRQRPRYHSAGRARSAALACSRPAMSGLARSSGSLRPSARARWWSSSSMRCSRRCEGRAIYASPSGLASPPRALDDLARRQRGPAVTRRRRACVCLPRPRPHLRAPLLQNSAGWCTPTAGSGASETACPPKHSLGYAGLGTAGRHLTTARIPSTTKSTNRISCATRNGGSDWVGASRFKPGTFKNAWMTPTKTFR